MPGPSYGDPRKGLFPLNAGVWLKRFTQRRWFNRIFRLCHGHDDRAGVQLGKVPSILPVAVVAAFAGNRNRDRLRTPFIFTLFFIRGEKVDAVGIDNIFRLLKRLARSVKKGLTFFYAIH